MERTIVIGIPSEKEKADALLAKLFALGIKEIGHDFEFIFRAEEKLWSKIGEIAIEYMVHAQMYKPKENAKISFTDFRKAYEIIDDVTTENSNRSENQAINFLVDYLETHLESIYELYLQEQE